MALPKQYQWLNNESGPKMLLEGLKTYGTLEVPGPKSSPIIMGWAKELGLSNVYTNDGIAWCGLWMNYVYLKADKVLPKTLNNQKMLWALNWSLVGDGVSKDDAQLGDILTFKRNGGGHVGMYIAEDKQCFHVMGGNQSDSVSITRIEKSRLYAVRRPSYNNKPTNVRKIIMTASGPISKNEA